VSWCWVKFPFFHTKKPDIEIIRQQKNIPALIQALRYDDFEVQTRAAEALGSLGTEGIDELILALKTKDKDVRLGIIEALAVLRDPRSVPSLIPLLTDTSNEIRWEAAIALGEINDPRAIPSLQQALRDPDKYVRYGAASALRKMRWKPPTVEEDAFVQVGLEEWQAVREIGEPAIPALSHVLSDRDNMVRIQSIDILGSIGDEKAIPALIRSLADENSEVRWKTVLASPKCGVPMIHLPRGLSRRPRTRKNPLVAGFLNFMLPGLGYGYLGKWWGIMIFQIDITVTVWLFRYEGEANTYGLLLPLYVVMALHAWYIAQKMPEF
jgi:HEAT repeats/Armadillo/beta-catenin-like repeat